MYVVVRQFWISDDAFITFRVLNNLHEGFGARFNIHERVQVYTHPLWFLLLAAGNLSLNSPIVSSVVLSVSCIALTWYVAVLSLRRHHTETALALGGFLGLLLSSKAFVDYTSSGLETPLSYFLVGVLVALTFSEKCRVQQVLFLSALLILTRHDQALLVAPASVFLAYQVWKKSGTVAMLRKASPAVFVLACWHLFSLLYYGFLVPNTAYAKLNIPFARSDVLEQGWWYFQESWHFDPATLLLQVAALVVVFLRKSITGFLCMLGVVGYLGYVYWIGGDFMGGRFFAVPFCLSAFVFSLLVPARVLAGVGIVAALYSLTVVYQPGTSDVTTATSRPFFHGISDEKSFYAKTNMLFVCGIHGYEKHEFAIAGLREKERDEKIILTATLGMRSFVLDPHQSIFDTFAIASPFLARMPIVSGEYRPGHVERLVPKRFVPSELSGENRFQPGKRKELYKLLQTITQGPLLSIERLKAVVKIHLIDFGFMDLSEVSPPPQKLQLPM